MGTQRLRRGSRRISRTEARALAVLAELDEALAAVALLQEQPRGRLKINLPMTFGFLHLAPALGDFMGRCASAACLAGHGEPQSPKALRQHRCLH